MRVDWAGHDRHAWDAAHAAAAAAWQQDWAYGAAVEAVGGAVRRAVVVDGGVPVALAQFTCRRFGGLVAAGLCTFGPVWLTALDGAGKAAVLAALKRGFPSPRPRLVAVTPDEPWSEDLGTRRLTRVMTGGATVRLDLAPDLDTLRAGLRPKWRNRLVSSEKSELKTARVGVKEKQYRWLLEREDAQRGAKGYRAPPAVLVPAYAAAKGGRDALLIVRADLGRAAAAAMLFVIHGRAATYHLGWSDEAGRKLAAHNLILWNAIKILKDIGVTALDLGGVDTGPGAGIARFKLGTGGDVVIRAGTFI